MNNNLNQDNYLLNQNTQQQYLNIQSYEQQGGETQKIVDFEYTLEFQDSKIRTDFVKKVYVLLALEFFIIFLFIALGTASGMVYWLFIEEMFCYYDTQTEKRICERFIVPSPLFYISLVISIIIQISLYFGGNTLRKGPFPYLILIPQLIFFGFTFATICIQILIGTEVYDKYYFVYTESYNFLASLIITFLIIIFQTIYLNVSNRDFSFKICAIITICIAIFFLIILPLIDSFYIGECFIYSLFSVLYTFYLMFETKLMMCRGTLKLESGDCLFGSLLLNALMIQPIVRIFDMIGNIFCGRNRK